MDRWKTVGVSGCVRHPLSTLALLFFLLCCGADGALWYAMHSLAFLIKNILRFYLLIYVLIYVNGISE